MKWHTGTFAKTSQVDTRSARFWASTYGEMMLRVSRNIMLDLESELSCKITLPEVVAVFGNTVTMDLGRMHGVKEGDQLQLWHTASFIDQNGLPRNKVSQSEITLTVSRVYEHEAELTIDQPNLASSVRANWRRNEQDVVDARIKHCHMPTFEYHRQRILFDYAPMAQLDSAVPS